jgi:hypothetical protein
MYAAETTQIIPGGGLAAGHTIVMQANRCYYRSSMIRSSVTGMGALPLRLNKKSSLSASRYADDGLESSDF